MNEKIESNLEEQLVEAELLVKELKSNYYKEDFTELDELLESKRSGMAEAKGLSILFGGFTIMMYLTY